MADGDKKLVCAEAGCGKEFAVSTGEQEFYASKGFTLPRRCAECRRKRRAEGQKTAEVKPAPVRSESVSAGPAGESVSIGPIGEAIAEAKRRGTWREERHRENRRRHGREVIGDFEGED